jgi:hypothetical protein
MAKHKLYNRGGGLESRNPNRGYSKQPSCCSGQPISHFVSMSTNESHKAVYTVCQNTNPQCQFSFQKPFYKNASALSNSEMPIAYLKVWVKNVFYLKIF